MLRYALRRSGGDAVFGDLLTRDALVTSTADFAAAGRSGRT
jgi:hypothetical protein